MFYRQKYNRHLTVQHKSALRTMKIMISFGLIGILSVVKVAADSEDRSANSPFALAQRAVKEISQSKYPAAMGHIKLALQSAPDSPVLHCLAGSLLLNTGDFKNARRAFENAVKCDSADPLASYGLGLADLASGNRKSALSSFADSEKNGGDPAYLLIARRYTQWLDGAQISVEGAGLPESFLSAQMALDAMSAYRLNKLQQASELLANVDKSIPGESLSQMSGVLITFDQSRALMTTGNVLPGSRVLIDSGPSKTGLKGDIVFTPETVVPGTSYATYELEGVTLSLTNSPPFQVVWDSKQTSNGLHDLTVILFSQNGIELTRATRRIKIYNPGGISLNCVPEELDRLRSSIWQSMSLQPDRGAAAYIRGMVYRSLHDTKAAGQSFAEACALHPDFTDARAQLAAAGGLNTGEDAVWGGSNTENVVALTFDDGPKPGMTEPLLQILVEQKIPATFFVIGRHVTEFPELTKQISDAGMEIANHSYSHPNLTKISVMDAAAELMRTQTAIARVTGKFPRYMRPPGGNWNKSLAAIVKYWGLTACMWSVDAYGAEIVSAQQVADTVLAQVHPGSIILMHNGKMSTIQALPTILSELKRRGYKFATVGDLVRRLKSNQALLKQVSVPKPVRTE